MKQILAILFCCSLTQAIGQGLNHQWLMGSTSLMQYDKGRMQFDTNAYSLQTEIRKMPFWGTNASICDSAGNLLMSSNGVWIANATGDTMDNGAGLNPGQNVNSWPNGLLNFYANIILPYPGDTNKYVLFHHTDTNDGVSLPAMELFYSIIDITLDSGRGSVISKNNIAFSDTLNWGIAACRHANGRDWWVVMQQHNSDTIVKLLFSSAGIQSIAKQKLNVPSAWYNVTQLIFSPDGKKFAYTLDDNTTTKNGTLVYFDFDRCTGMFSNEHSILIEMGAYFWGISFSPSSQFIYVSTSGVLFQFEIATMHVDTIAIYDGFYDLPNAYTTFGHHYLAANGHIYLTSMGSALRIHEIMAPDSADTLCNFQQHNIFLNFWNFRAVPNHPNYYLGCDTTLGCGCATGVQENYALKKLNIYPNPNNGNFNIGYDAMPTSSVLTVYDINGKKVYEQNLPAWSNEQNISLKNVCDGMYMVTVTNAEKKVGRKIIVQRE